MMVLGLTGDSEKHVHLIGTLFSSLDLKWHASLPVVQTSPGDLETQPLHLLSLGSLEHQEKKEGRPWQTQLVVVRLTLQKTLPGCSAVNGEAQLRTGSHHSALRLQA